MRIENLFTLSIKNTCWYNIGFNAISLKAKDLILNLFDSLHFLRWPAFQVISLSKWMVQELWLDSFNYWCIYLFLFFVILIRFTIRVEILVDFTHLCIHFRLNIFVFIVFYNIFLGFWLSCLFLFSLSGFFSSPSRFYRMNYFLQV